MDWLITNENDKARSDNQWVNDAKGNLVNRSIVPKGYDSVEDFLKVVDDTTIKEFGYDSIEEFRNLKRL
ncbi:hypothetical protein ACQRXC_18230 [Niallia taxi]|uniref:hypothetical protein n=1 Tax=Niallia taxi TaxID=2499688 RepID=UPI00196A3538